MFPADLVYSFSWRGVQSGFVNALSGSLSLFCLAIFVSAYLPSWLSVTIRVQNSSVTSSLSTRVSFPLFGLSLLQSCSGRAHIRHPKAVIVPCSASIALATGFAANHSNNNAQFIFFVPCRAGRSIAVPT